jgi:hypothetical protein
VLIGLTVVRLFLAVGCSSVRDTHIDGRRVGGMFEAERDGWQGMLDSIGDQFRDDEDDVVGAVSGDAPASQCAADQAACHASGLFVMRQVPGLSAGPGSRAH